MAFIPATTETKIEWVQRIAGFPIAGPFLMLLGTALPATIYVVAMQHVLHVDRLPNMHYGVAFILATLWATVVWFVFETRFRVLFIPAPLLYLGFAIAGYFGLMK